MGQWGEMGQFILFLNYGNCKRFFKIFIPESMDHWQGLSEKNIDAITAAAPAAQYELKSNSFYLTRSLSRITKVFFSESSMPFNSHRG